MPKVFIHFIYFVRLNDQLRVTIREAIEALLNRIYYVLQNCVIFIFKMFETFTRMSKPPIQSFQAGTQLS